MGDKPQPFVWTAETLEKAKDLIRRGYSAQQVAVQIDAPSRNVVIGRMRREGFAGGGKPATRRPKPVDDKNARWTPERERRAIELFDAGCTHEEIAATLGNTSKSAVCSYLARKGYKRDYTIATRSAVQKLVVGRAGPAVYSANSRVEWTYARQQYAIQLFNEGMSYGEIAQKMSDCSEGYVRKKLTAAGYIRTCRPSDRYQIAKIAAQKRDPSSDTKERKPPMLRLLDASEANIALPESRKISLMQIKAGLCRWPLGDPLKDGFCYCGADTDLLTHSYCPSHRLLARGTGTPGERRAAETLKAVA